MVTLAEIFRQHGPAYREQFGNQMPPSHHRAMIAIEQCRTEVLGGHVYRCPDCGEERYSYHSCKNRHCPRCQHDATQAWLEKQQEMLLPAPYFMLTFTLPEGLRDLARRRQKLIYRLLFRASAAATQELARDPRFVGGQIGMIGVLQTWTRDLAYHPHVHYLVPGGGLAPDGEHWLPSRANFLLPVKALSILFRAKFCDALRGTELFEQIPAEVWRQPWVVHCQPVGDGRTALKYLAPYVFRVAISNRRIVKLEHGLVTFAYKDGHSGQKKIRTVSAEEFIRRFLQHVLPKGFCKVRYYGFFSAGQRQTLQRVRQVLGVPIAAPEPQEAADIARPARSPMRCPTCHQEMQCVSVLRPINPWREGGRNRSPPS